MLLMAAVEAVGVIAEGLLLVQLVVLLAMRRRVEEVHQHLERRAPGQAVRQLQPAPDVLCNVAPPACLQRGQQAPDVSHAPKRAGEEVPWLVKVLVADEGDLRSHG